MERERAREDFSGDSRKSEANEKSNEPLVDEVGEYYRILGVRDEAELVSNLNQTAGALGWDNVIEFLVSQTLRVVSIQWSVETNKFEPWRVRSTGSLLSSREASATTLNRGVDPGFATYRRFVKRVVEVIARGESGSL
jgi:hypothetical protein